MRKFKKAIISIASAITLAITPLNSMVYAEDAKANLLGMTYEELEDATGGIIGAITTNDINALNGVSAYLTTGTLYELQQFVQESRTHGTLVRMHIDKIEQSGSSDNDMVIMTTAITNISGYEYYTLYEFHVDTIQGKIYGYNVWVY